MASPKVRGEKQQVEPAEKRNIVVPERGSVPRGERQNVKPDKKGKGEEPECGPGQKDEKNPEKCPKKEWCSLRGSENSLTPCARVVPAKEPECGYFIHLLKADRPKGYEGVDVGDRLRVQLIHTDVEKGYIDFKKIN